MAGAPAGGGQQNDNSLAAMWITIGIFILAWLIWHYFSAYIVFALFKIKALEIMAMAPIASLIETIQNTFNQTFEYTLDSAKQFIETVPPAQVSASELGLLSDTVGRYLRYPTAILLVILAFVVYFSNVAESFKRTFNMKSLREQEQHNWRQIMPVSNLNLLKHDIDKGPWAMADNPMMFAKRHQLIVEGRITPGENSLEKESDVITASLNKSKARRVFSMQLGRVWTGADTLNNYTKALFAIFAARINHDRDSADKLIQQISESTSRGKLNFSGVTPVLNKYKDSPIVKMVIKKHAYVNTVMSEMLHLARVDGVLASADFLWLKPVDRTLWYTLNSVGRQTVFSEIAGIKAHWLAEREIGRPLNVPMVEQAVLALDAAFKEIIYIPEEGEENSGEDNG